MHTYIYLIFGVSLITLLLTVVLGQKNEKRIGAFVLGGSSLNLLVSFVWISHWIINGLKPFSIQEFSLYEAKKFNFFIDFYFDFIGATYLLVGSLLYFLVAVYSRNYMQGKHSFQRFFSTIQFFFLGYLIVVLSGNFETLFVGWEILGLSSFLLIAFYRLSYNPVKNAVKVFSIYRIGDVGLILAMWMSHHLWHENVTFHKLHQSVLVHEHLISHSTWGIFISVMLVMAAAAKSAQFPFTSWLPRAMEGPTPSSAIFYGSLSVHIGVFLLLRTHPFWDEQIVIRWGIAVLGIVTAVISSLTAQAQSNVKGQIAYSSAAQIGLMFVEIALGFEVLALVHFTGNAFLRTYQLLVTPSVVTYQVRQQFFNYVPKTQASFFNRKFPRLATTLYLLSLQEWRLESLVFRVFYGPIKKFKKPLQFLQLKITLLFVIPIYLMGWTLAYSFPIKGELWQYVFANTAAIVGVLLSFKAYNERKSSRNAWLLLILAHFFIDLAVTFNDQINLKEAGIYLSGIVISGALGWWILIQLRKKEAVGLNQFHGFIVKYEGYGILFLIACLGLAGFPITTTFFGEDIILTHISSEQWLLAALVSFNFIVIGIAAIRLYARVFLGKIHNDFQKTTDITF